MMGYFDFMIQGYRISIVDEWNHGPYKFSFYILGVAVNHHQYIIYAFHGTTLCGNDDGILSTILILFRANEIVKNGNMCEQQWQYVTPNNGSGSRIWKTIMHQS